MPGKGCRNPGSCRSSQRERETLQLFRSNPVEQIVASDHCKRERGQGDAWQVDQSSQRDHRPADRPDHLQNEKVERRIKRPAKKDYGKFEQRQPCSAREEKEA